MKRNRYLTRDELASTLAERADLTLYQAEEAVTALAELGVPVDSLVKMQFDEEPTVHPSRD